MSNKNPPCLSETQMVFRKCGSMYSCSAICWYAGVLRGRTDRLHLCHLSLEFDDGAVEFLLLGSQLQLQLPVFFLFPVHLGVGAPVTSSHRLSPVHHLSELVDSLESKKKRKERKHGDAALTDLFMTNLNSE